MPRSVGPEDGCRAVANTREVLKIGRCYIIMKLKFAQSATLEIYVCMVAFGSKSKFQFLAENHGL